MEQHYPVLPKMKRRWLVVYTRPRWEKKVDGLLKERGIESYCPVTTMERQWADRKKMVEFPLFNGYLFVNVNLKEELTVRETLGVLNFIYYQGKPAEVRESVINDIKHYLNVCPDLETVSIQSISVGQRLKIKDGMFLDHEGEVLQIQGKNIVMVLEHLDCALVTKVPVHNVALIN